MIFRFAIAAAFVLVLSVGCGSPSDVGFVTGVVTLDGEPVQHGSVSFYPAGGRASVGGTKQDGSYELIYTRSRKGALIGEHKVTIAQEKESSISDDEPAAEFKKANIPRKYTNEKTTDLTATVVQGNNVINFDLKSK